MDKILLCCDGKTAREREKKMEGGERVQSKQRTGKPFTPCLERSVTAATGEEREEDERVRRVGVRKRKSVEKREKKGG